jgi:hypothetical protein
MAEKRVSMILQTQVCIDLCEYGKKHRNKTAIVNLKTGKKGL